MNKNDIADTNEEINLTIYDESFDYCNNKYDSQSAITYYDKSFRDSSYIPLRSNYDYSKSCSSKKNNAYADYSYID